MATIRHSVNNAGASDYLVRRAFLSVFFSSFAVACLYGQTTQGLISGRALDSRSGRPLEGATDPLQPR